MSNGEADVLGVVATEAHRALEATRWDAIRPRVFRRDVTAFGRPSDPLLEQLGLISRYPARQAHIPGRLLFLSSHRAGDTPTWPVIERFVDRGGTVIATSSAVECVDLCSLRSVGSLEEGPIALDPDSVISERLPPGLREHFWASNNAFRVDASDCEDAEVLVSSIGGDPLVVRMHGGAITYFACDPVQHYLDEDVVDRDDTMSPRELAEALGLAPVGILERQSRHPRLPLVGTLAMVSCFGEVVLQAFRAPGSRPD